MIVQLEARKRSTNTGAWGRIILAALLGVGAMVVV